MKARRILFRTLRRSVQEVLGWILLFVGFAALFLPGPGLLMMFGGVACLSANHGWARRVVHGLERRAKIAARESVQTPFRIGIGILGGVWMLVCGVIWWKSVNIPRFEIAMLQLGPELPFHGWVTGLLLMSSGVIAWILLMVSWIRYRHYEAPQSTSARFKVPFTG